jgi:hypothetical protein
MLLNDGVVLDDAFVLDDCVPFLASLLFSDLDRLPTPESGMTFLPQLITPAAQINDKTIHFFMLLQFEK